jgi:hypothetical protein
MAHTVSYQLHQAALRELALSAMPDKPGLIAAVEGPCLLLHGERRAPATTR